LRTGFFVIFDVEVVEEVGGDLGAGTRRATTVSADVG
jgi:hypothetical protein